MVPDLDKMACQIVKFVFIQFLTTFDISCKLLFFIVKVIYSQKLWITLWIKTKISRGTALKAGYVTNWLKNSQSLSY